MREKEVVTGDTPLFILGQLEPEAVSRFETALAQADAEALREFAAVTETVAAIGLTVPLVQPPPGLRARLLQQLTPAVPPPATSQGMVFAPAGEARWLPGPAPGVEVRPLLRDKTMLVRMAPGARIPVHHHASGEQCLVIDGALTDGEITVETGDFVYMPAGTTHRELTTTSGCTFLIMYA